MNYKLLNIHSHPLTSYFLEDAFILENEYHEEEYFMIPNGSIGIYAILQGEGAYMYGINKLKLPPLLISGLINKPLRSIVSKKYKAVGFRFKPEFLQLILKNRISDIKSQAVSLNDIVPDVSYEHFMESLIKAKSEYCIMETFNHFLHRNLHTDKLDKRVEYALSKIRNGKILNIGSLSNELNISSTSLRTLFNSKVGITPKELIKIYRLQRALKSQDLKEENLTQLAYSLGYYDQAHFIHEFKDTMGLSPLKYFSNEKLTFDFYNFDRLRVSSFVT